MKLVDAVPDAVENIKELVREMKDTPKKDIKRKEPAYKASVDVFRAVGIMPSPVQPQLITNIYSDNKPITLNPVIKAHNEWLMGTRSGEEETEEKEPDDDTARGIINFR